MVSEQKTTVDIETKPSICAATMMREPAVPAPPAPEVKKKRHSWAVDVEREYLGIYDSDSLSSLDHSNDGIALNKIKEEQKQTGYVEDSENAMLEFPTVKTEIKEELKMELVEQPLTSQQQRDISLDFIEVVNEQKYERLLQQEKVKTPFKRRHSHTREATRPNSPSQQDEQADDNYDSGSVRDSDSTRYKKRARNNSLTSSGSSASYIEEDPATLSRRQKQIDYGKNTLAYDLYVEQVPRNKRTRDHPKTPNKYGKYSRRAFDGLIKIWRKQLHYYDPPKTEETAKNASFTDSDSDSE